MMDRDCNECVYSARDGSCRKWSCEGTKTVEDVKMDTFKESVKILRGIDKQVAYLFENLVMNADYYNRKGK